MATRDSEMSQNSPNLIEHLQTVIQT